ncbi:MAG: hypothetical protein ACLSAH_22490 [Bilophila wadsworthia]
MGHFHRDHHGRKWKAAGQGGELTDEERRYFQERINTLHAIFKADVGRRWATADPHQGQAQLLLAQLARELGLSPISSGSTPRSANSLLGTDDQRRTCRAVPGTGGRAAGRAG